MTTATTVNVQFQLRADTAANWTAANPILLTNEFALETDTKKLKVGDGTTAWASLAYFPSIVTGGTVLGNLEIGSTGTLTFEGATVNDYETTLAVTDPTADRTITLPDQSGTVVVSGNASIVDADIAAGAEIAVSKLANGTANQVLVTDGTDVSWSNDLTIAGNLTVNGTTTTVNTETLVVEDKNIELGVVDTPTDLTADGGGITLKGTTDKTINWVDATDAWTSSERFSVPLGSAASPSLTFTGDENTGIYSPGADQLALSTNGTGRLFVSANGVGIGAAEVTGYGGLQVRNNFIYVNEDGANTKQLYIRTDTPGIQVASNDPFRILTNNQERLRITSAGLVGIGTSSPGVQLHLANNTSNSYAQMRLAGSNRGGVIDFYNTSFPVAQLEVDQSGNIAVRSSLGFAQPDVHDVVYINSSGQVGIGTTSPGNYDLGADDLVVANSGNGGVSIITGTSSVGALYFGDGTTSNQPYRGRIEYKHAEDSLNFGSAGSLRATIDSSGRLLVGTSSDSGGALLQVNGDRVRIATAKTPASASATGTAGEVCWDTNYIYVCTATNTWKRAALSTW